MDQKETEELVEELETRVERLRALYDMYFMGIEKTIPSVPQKDVERRFYVLRRVQIRNTALRFRFHNVLLRYNTYQTYWMRICRQIEEGTYKRDVRRANARFANAPVPFRAKKRDEPSFDVDFEEPDDVDVNVDFDARPGLSFEADELARAREEVAKIRAALRQSKIPKDLEPLPPRADPPTDRKIAAAKAARGGGYAQRGAGRKRTSDLPPPLPVADAEPSQPARPASRRPSSRPGPNTALKRRASRPDLSARAPAAPPRARASSSPALRAPARGPSSALTDERVRQIYTQYVETKRRTGESTAAITFDSLARSLRDSSEKLREKHVGRSVDFEVTVKDGKAILRPIVK